MRHSLLSRPVHHEVHDGERVVTVTPAEEDRAPLAAGVRRHQSHQVQPCLKPERRLRSGVADPGWSGSGLRKQQRDRPDDPSPTIENDFDVAVVRFTRTDTDLPRLFHQGLDTGHQVCGHPLLECPGREGPYLSLELEPLLRSHTGHACLEEAPAQG